MARIRTGRSLRRRRRSSPSDDRMSALPDDLLLLVLRRLDARSALGTALLSTRWARLHRELPVLDFRVGSMLPPRYHRLVLLLDDMDIKGAYLRFKRRCELMPKVRRYERGAMRALSRSIESFLDDEVVRGVRRSVSRLRLEFFINHNPGCMNRLIAKSIDDWGVSDLEAVAKPIYFEDSIHTFPSHGLCHDPRASLKLVGCALPPLHEFSALTMLVLQDITGSTSKAAYEGVFTMCSQLQVLQLKSCDCRWEDRDLVVDAPSSHIRELVFDKCTLGRVLMRALPNLESLASRDTDAMLQFDQSTSFPSLRQCNHTTSVGLFRTRMGRPREYIGHQRELGSFLGRTPYITNLILRFTGPRRWVVPSPSGSSSPLLPKLRKLLAADVPSSWDVSWPRLLLEMAPSLETLHIHIAPCRERAGCVIPWEPTKLRRRHLKEFVVVGFHGTKRQISFVKFVMGVSTSLRRVALFRNGRAEEDKGHWDWVMVTEQHSWTNRQKNATQKKIMDGVSFSRRPAQFVFADPFL
ncbi:hypothetical protein VPH35_106105 [Triticum aestivum]